MYEDKTLICKECGEEFIFTAGEQEFYAEKGFENEPQRCKACRDARKNAARADRASFPSYPGNSGTNSYFPLLSSILRKTSPLKKNVFTVNFHFPIPTTQSSP